MGATKNYLLIREDFDETEDSTIFANPLKRSGLRKLAEPNDPTPCLSSEHNPPSHYVYTPGKWEYICPACGKRVIFFVNGPLF